MEQETEKVIEHIKSKSPKTKNVSSAKLVKKINMNVKNRTTEYIPTVKEAAGYLRKNLKGGEAVIVMGAGDIYSEFKKYF